MKPRTLILRTAGTNCDRETAHAFERAGSEAVFLHVNRLLENRALLGEFQILAIPGGFSYGDDIAAGRIFANQLVHHLGDAIREFIAGGNYYWFDSRNVRTNVQLMKVDGSPVSSVFGFYVGGQRGHTVSVATSFYF